MELHIIPIDDKHRHEYNSRCECFPDVKYLGDAIIYLHYPYDNRPEIYSAWEILEEWMMSYGWEGVCR